MKKKTRNMIIDEKEYVYVLNQKYNEKRSHITLKVSLKDKKNLTLTFLFCTWDDPITGSPLLIGVDLKNKKTNKVETFNLHHPKTIKKFILYGLRNGWTGENIIEFQNGLEILSEMGYDIAWLTPKTNH
ncbi:hypothetical protein SAMN05661091_3929 [Paenibacillus uliginis N3/975]|uniref:Uncharacterized protein n=1 Tax=Paenibacillus uliginis N3/975 TaxID=1313296 RepID=A0A1X7HKN9_9BACL|nr:hypothetical protein [Paenibacillus uliginis]SMF87797.1 hypothetical protein SAMN05661091_3929 [Paenibacillus uliginis N3/975]